MNVSMVINALIMVILVVVISFFCIDMKEPYPRKIIELYSEPHIRFFTYIALYFITMYNYVLGFVSAIGIILLHIDYVNLVKI